jgi:hypothetical protein
MIETTITELSPCVQIYPMRGLHEASVAKIADLVEDVEEASCSARKALDVLAITNTDSSHISHLVQIWNQTG